MNVYVPELLGFIAEDAVFGASTADWVVNLVFTCIAAVTLVIILSVVLGVRQARRARELEHTERMKALEMGRGVPGAALGADGGAAADETMGFKALVKVPLYALGIALAANVMIPSHFSPTAWVAAGMVGVAGVVCGTILILRQTNPTGPPAAPAKPVFDHEVHDFTAPRF